MSMITARKTVDVEDGRAPDKPCSFCGRMTPHTTLVDLGARCVPCYQAYREEDRGFPKAPHVPGPLGWVHRLKWRKDHGEALSRLQLEMIEKHLNETP
jgi:hypothetical protein